MFVHHPKLKRLFNKAPKKKDGAIVTLIPSKETSDFQKALLKELI